MWTFGFFNSINGDRAYNAEQLSSIFEGLISSGVYESVGNKLAVQPNDLMTIQINTGRGWFGGHWVNNDTVHLITLEDADVLLNRWAAICIRVDTTTAQRMANPYVKYSDFATTPTKPTMERSDNVKEYCLAYVYIRANATAITASDITDTRGDNELCGWVTGLIEQLDSKTLFEQFEDLFLNWFNNLQNYLDDNVEAKLAADMQTVKATVPIKAIGTFDGLGWDSQPDGTYTQAVTIEGVTADNDILVAPDDGYRDAYIRMNCEAISQAENTIVFRCENPEDINIRVKVIIFNDVI